MQATETRITTALLRKHEAFGTYLQTRVSTNTAKMYIYWVSRMLRAQKGDSLAAAQRFIDELSCSRSTVAIAYHSVKRYLKWSGEEGSLDAPMKKGLVYREPKYLDMQVIEEALAKCRWPLERALVAMLFDTACRIGEILALNISDVDYEHGTIKVVRKGGKVDIVNISEKGLKALAGWLEYSPPNAVKVFGDMSYQLARQTVRRVGERVGVKMNPHTLRHSRAVQMIKAGATIADVQQHLGHESIIVTANTYGWLFPSDLKQRIPEW